MICPNCRAEIPNGSANCPNCGVQFVAQPAAAPGAPARQVKTNRHLWKWIVFSIITFGIYPIVMWSGISSDINTIASRYDGKKTMHYCIVFFLLTAITFGIVPLVWYTKLCGRIGNEQERRGMPKTVSGGTFWLWEILGTLFIVGPFIFVHKVTKAMNQIGADYNARG